MSGDRIPAPWARLAHLLVSPEAGQSGQESMVVFAVPLPTTYDHARAREAMKKRFEGRVSTGGQ